MKKEVTLPDGTKVPALGQGTWHMGDAAARESGEIESLRTGVGLGMTLVDTAEMYGEGAAERLVGKAITGCERDELFITSKVYPWNAGRADIFASCDNSLKRIGTGYLDLYLLHWRGSVPLRETVECMEELKARGKIRRWGVSNFDTDDMEELWSVPGGDQCAVNQVLYHLGSRGIEYDLLPWLRGHGIPVMAYCPVAQAGKLRRQLLNDAVLREIAEKHGISVIQLLLAFVLSKPQVIAIPKASNPAHTRENAQAAQISLSGEELERIERAFPAPTQKVPLDVE